MPACVLPANPAASSGKALARAHGARDIVCAE
jgi:hypothetical protein